VGSRTRKNADQPHMDFLGEIGENVANAETPEAIQAPPPPAGNGPDEAVSMGFRVAVLTAAGPLCGQCRHRTDRGECAELGVRIDERGASRCDAASLLAHKEVA